ncbi:unnamed protein product [Pylaiella littoralis]
MRYTFLTAAAVGGTTFSAVGRVRAFVLHGACARTLPKHHQQIQTILQARKRSSLADGATGGVAERIHKLAGREFDIGKPSVLAKVLFDDMEIFHPQANSKALTAAGRLKPRSVSVKTLSAILQVEQDPVKRELVQLVREWLGAKAVAKRGGFVAVGAKVADVPDWTSCLIPDGDDLRVDPSAAPVMIIDGHYLIFRSFHGMPPLTTEDGTPVGALVGFCNVMNKLVLQPWADGVEPRRKMIVAFDSGLKNFRHDLSPAYKKDRAEAPDALRPQFALIKEACQAYGLETVEAVGFEADDVIASLALEAITTGATNVTIVSSDKDLAQLVTRRVNMLDVYTGERMGPEEVLAKFLAPPGRLADLLSIAGDKSDGVVGAEGYGPVKAAKVLANHATLAEAVDDICSAMAKRNEDPARIQTTRDEVFLARRLVDLCTMVPLDKRTGPRSLAEMPAFQLKGDLAASRLLDFMRRFEMEDLAQRTSRMLGVDENLS